jgi:hypothetical protein
MKRMFVCACIAEAVGFVVLVVMFLVATPNHVGERSLWIVFSITGAIPVAAIAALFSAVKTIQEELRETRRELKHWQSMQMYEDPEGPSTKIKPASPSGRL